MDDPNQQMNNDLGVSAALSGQMNNDVGVSAALSGQIIIAGVVLIFVIFIALLILYLRAFDTVGSSRSRRLVFAPQEPTLPRHALDPSILNSLPITIFQSKDFEEYSCLECAVCLCELQDGEDVRLLPKCNHGFHVECIDMWFHSNNTCPLCRSLVNAETTAAATETSVEIPTEPIAIEAGLETGSSSNNLNEGSSSCAGSSSSCASWRKRKEGVLVIDVPTRIVGAFSSPNTPLPSNKVPSNSPLPTSRRLEEFKSPVFGRMKSLKRILSRGKASFKGASSSYSSIGCDIEQGGLADSKCQ